MRIHFPFPVLWRSLSASPRRQLPLRDLLSLARSRRALANLSKAQLRDAGITPEEARHEAARKPWDASASWRR